MVLLPMDLLRLLLASWVAHLMAGSLRLLRDLVVLRVRPDFLGLLFEQLQLLAVREGRSQLPTALETHSQIHCCG